MKKSILFIINNLMIGGAEKALISLLQNFDYSKYNVDLLLLKKESEFINDVPNEVNIIDSPEEFTYFNISLKSALLKSLKKMRFDIFFSRIAWAFVGKTVKIPNRKEQVMWKYISYCLKKQEKNYDVAIGYLQKTPNYYCVDKVKAIKKIGYVHTDYAKSKMDSKIDFPYFNSLDHILTISKTNKETLVKIFSNIKEKFNVMHNIVPKKTIKNLSLEPIDFKKKGISLLSLGRLNAVKGYDLAINACKILVDKGVNVYWYILGKGEEKANLEKLIKANNLTDRFFLLGAKENPYPYIKSADIYVHPSRYEGKSIAIEEVKILCKPIVVTNYPAVTDQLTDGVNALMADISPTSLAERIELLISNKELQEKFIHNLNQDNYSIEKEMNYFYGLIES